MENGCCRPKEDADRQILCCRTVLKPKDQSAPYTSNNTLYASQRSQVLDSLVLRRGSQIPPWERTATDNHEPGAQNNEDKQNHAFEVWAMENEGSTEAHHSDMNHPKGDA